MRYSLRTLLLLTILGPPVLAGLWLWCRQLIADALILLACELLAAAILIPVLAVVALLSAIAKRAVGLARVLLRPIGKQWCRLVHNSN